MPTNAFSENSGKIRSSLPLALKGLSVDDFVSLSAIALAESRRNDHRRNGHSPAHVDAADFPKYDYPTQRVVAIA